METKILLLVEEVLFVFLFGLFSWICISLIHERNASEVPSERKRLLIWICLFATCLLLLLFLIIAVAFYFHML